MERKLISRYEVLVYNTGEIEFHPLIEESNFSKCSSSMRQVLSIIEFVLKYKKEYPHRNIHYGVITAVNRVAQVERVASTTVHSKIIRKLGLSMQEFKSQLNTCIETKAPDDDIFVQRLYSSCVIRNKQADEDGVKKVIEEIQNS